MPRLSSTSKARYVPFYRIHSTKYFSSAEHFYWDESPRRLRALMPLPDQAVREIKPGEIAEFGVVRVADEILVDLMKSGCGVDYADAIRDAVYWEIEGVRIPFASPRTLWRVKQTRREKDIPDRLSPGRSQIGAPHRTGTHNGTGFIFPGFGPAKAGSFSANCSKPKASA